MRKFVTLLTYYPFMIPNIKHCFAAIAVLAAVPLSAQTTREEIYADIAKAGGLYYAYPGPQSVQTPAPKGYKPFYISHFGRHGSRWCSEKHVYYDIVTTLDSANTLGVLTPWGQDVLRRYTLAYEDAHSRYGELTPRGYAQHQGIAGRMYASFPEVFEGNVHVVANATRAVRVTVSMMAFCDKLKQLNPGLRIDADASVRDMPFLQVLTHESAQYEVSDSLVAETARFRAGHLHPGRLMDKLFNSKEFIGSIDTVKLFDDMAEIALILQNSDLDFELYDVFTPEELFDKWQIRNYVYYTTKCCDPAGGYTLTSSAIQILRHVIDNADAAVAGTGPAANLRFSHDAYLVPLATALQLDGCRGVSHDSSRYYEVFSDFKISPMGGNLQLIFFRNKAGEVIVKFLLNENEVGIPLETDMWPYYRWDDVRAYYVAYYNMFWRPDYE